MIDVLIAAAAFAVVGVIVVLRVVVMDHALRRIRGQDD